MEELRSCTTQTLNSKKDSKTYDIPIRKAIGLLQQVSVETAFSVIENFIKKMTEPHRINFLPDKTTVSKMAYMS